MFVQIQQISAGLFADSLISTLGKVGATESVLENAWHSLGPLVCDSDCDRSVQGSLNQLGKLVRFGLLGEGGSVMDLAPYSTAAWLAEMPTNVRGRGYQWPIKAMLSLLSQGREE